MWFTPYSVVLFLLSTWKNEKDSNGETVFPQGFYSDFLESAKQYTDILSSKEATYRLFSSLKEKFNGDTLQVTEVEKEIITQKDLDELRTFILGDSELESRQLALWPFYSFDIIPIQLISSIYELFFTCQTKMMRRARIIRLSILSTWSWMKYIRGKASIKIYPFLIHHAVQAFS